MALSYQELNVTPRHEDANGLPFYDAGTIRPMYIS